MASKSTSDRFPGFDEIFDLGNPGSSRVYIGDIELPDESDSAIPPHYGVLRGEWIPPAPLDVKWYMGRSVPGDAIWTSYAIPLVLGDNAWRVLNDGGFSGFSDYPVRVFDKSGQLAEGYKGLVVTGRCGAIDNSRSVVFDRQRPAGVFPAYKGLYFHEDSWDGTDMFCPADGSGFVFVTRPVRDALTRAKVRNLRFKPLSQFERSQL